MKKIVSVLLAVLLLSALSVTAFAASEPFDVDAVVQEVQKNLDKQFGAGVYVLEKVENVTHMYKLNWNGYYTGIAIAFNHMGKDGTAVSEGAVNHFTVVCMFENGSSSASMYLSFWTDLSSAAASAVLNVTWPEAAELVNTAHGKASGSSAGYAFSIGEYDFSVSEGSTSGMYIGAFQTQIRGLY